MCGRGIRDSRHERVCAGASAPLGAIRHADPATPGERPVAEAAPVRTGATGGGIQGATGYRYWTVSVSNLDEIATACEEAGYAIPLKPIEIPAAGRFLIVEDPDGNWVEFAEYADA